MKLPGNHLTTQDHVEDCSLAQAIEATPYLSRFCWFFSLCFSLFNEGFAGELGSVQKKTVGCKTSSGKPGQQHDIAVPSIDMIGKMLHQQKLKTGDLSPCIKTKNTRSIHDCVLVSSKSCVWSNMKHKCIIKISVQGLCECTCARVQSFPFSS